MYLEMIDESYIPKKEEPSLESIMEAYENKAWNFFNEAYYGKTPELLAIEKKIGEARIKYNNNRMKFNTSPERTELENMFADAFGFKCCNFIIQPSMLHNAYTIPVSSAVFDFRDYSKYIVSKTGKGIKYTKDANVYLIINVTKGLFFNNLYTDGEVLAIILHEIGHNFQTAISGKCRTLLITNKILNLLLFPIMIIQYPESAPWRNLYIDFKKYIDKNFSGLVHVLWIIKSIINTIVGIGYTGLAILSNIAAMMNPLTVIQNIPNVMMEKISNVFTMFGGYKGEAISDSFVSAYGYSTELSSALMKIEKNSAGFVANSIFREMPGIGAYFDLINIPTKIITNIFDPHPNTIARLNNQYDYIYTEMMKMNTTPAMKKELQAQLKEIQTTMDKFLDAESNGFFFSNRLDKWLLTCFGGDIRNATAKGNNEEFDQATKRAEEQLKMLQK